MEEREEGRYKKVSALVNNWLELHKGETFDLDRICRQLEIRERDNRNLVTIKLAYEVKHNRLEKTNNIYKYIDNTIKYIDWVNVDEEQSLNLTWPYGREDNSKFGFDGSVVISPRDIIVLTGNSNTCKTAFCLNLVWENMDKFHITLMGNEYTPIKFKRRIKRMDWANPLKEDGNPKFDLIERRDDWKYAIRPDNVNIIDWINLEDNFYKVGSIIDGVQSKLDKGIALIVLQKSPGKPLGLGGGFSIHLASLYLSVDFQVMTVLKAKEWFGHNPNNEMYSFEIVNHGTKFNNIRKVKKCFTCHGSGEVHGNKCDRCYGTGYMDA